MAAWPPFNLNNATPETATSKKRLSITMETKVDIIKKVECGEKMANVARAYGMNRSTIGTILKNKDRILEHVNSPAPLQSSVICKRRGRVIDEMEKLLLVWLEEQHQNRIPISLALIQDKARTLFQEVKVKYGESAAEETFVASKGWFRRFKDRTNLHYIKVAGHSLGGDPFSAKDFPMAYYKADYLAGRYHADSNSYGGSNPAAEICDDLPKILSQTDDCKLQHNHHHTLVLESLAEDESFMDLILTSEGQEIKAHKSVLSAMSPYFRRVLCNNPHQHTIIVMPRDIRFDVLKNLITFIYKGEVTVPSHEIPSLLRAAQTLEIRGLQEMEKERTRQHDTPTWQPSSSEQERTSFSDGSASPTRKSQDGELQGGQSTRNLVSVKEEHLSDAEETLSDDALATNNGTPLPPPAPSFSATPKLEESSSESEERTAKRLRLSPSSPSSSPLRHMTYPSPDPIEDPPSPTDPERAGSHLKDPLPSADPSASRVFDCTFCDQFFDSLENLRSHLCFNHQWYSPIICDCGVVFLHQSSLERHRQECCGRVASSANSGH